jgi:hypothetical protein
MIWWFTGWAVGAVISLLVVKNWTRAWARSIRDRGGSVREITGALRFGYLIAGLSSLLSWITVLMIILYMNDVDQGLR